MSASPFATAASAWTSRRSPARSSRSSRPRASARAPVSACRWSTASPRSSAAFSTSRARPAKGRPRRSGCPSPPRRPAAEDLESRPPIRAPRQAPILLVDDEELVRIGTAEMLTDLGYKVIEATSGAEALRLLRSGRRARPDDHRLSHAGHERRRTDRARPAARAIDEGDADHRLFDVAEGPAASVPRLAKPFRQNDLAEMVAQLLIPEPAGEVVRFPARTS